MIIVGPIGMGLITIAVAAAASAVTARFFKHQSISLEALPATAAAAISGVIAATLITRPFGSPVEELANSELFAGLMVRASILALPVVAILGAGMIADAVSQNVYPVRSRAIDIGICFFMGLAGAGTLPLLSVFFTSPDHGLPPSTVVAWFLGIATASFAASFLGRQEPQIRIAQ